MSAVSPVANNHAETPATVRCEPSGRVADISAASSEIRAPGRCTQARTRTGATGIGPRMSSTSRPIRMPGGACSSISLVINASGGEPCWILGSQLLPVYSVDSNACTSPVGGRRR